MTWLLRKWRAWRRERRLRAYVPGTFMWDPESQMWMGRSQEVEDDVTAMLESGELEA